MARRLSASVIGCGLGGRLSMTALAASERFDFVAAADMSPAACAKTAADYPGVQTFADPQAMFAACPTKHQIHLERLADDIEQAAPCYDVAESSLSALELCEAAYLSHRHRCTVTFLLGGFVPPPRNDWNPGQPYGGTGGGRDSRASG